MSFDAHKNFAYSTVATAPTPATSGTSLTVAAGTGTLFPATPFNATVWPAATQPLSTNAEIVRVTNVTGDVLTITRAQESTSAVSIAVAYQIAATITKKTIDDIEAAVAGAGITNVKLSAGTLSTLRSDLTFANSNGVTFGLNTNGVITASAAGGGGSLNVSAGTTSNNLTNLVFSNGSNVSFGLNGSTVTASVAPVTAGSDTFGISNLGNTAGTSGAVSGDQIRMLLAGGNNVTLSQSVNGASATVTVSVGNYLTTAMASNRGSDFVQATAAFAGTNASGTIASNGISVSVNAGGSDTFGISNLGNTAGTSGVASGTAVQMLLAGGNNVTLSQSINGASATVTVSVGNYLTTAMASNRGSDFVQASAAFAGTNASGTIASNGVSVSVGNYITTARASNDAIGLVTAQSNVTWTANSAGLSLDARGYAGTVTGATNASVTANSNGISVSVGPYLTTARASNDGIGLNTAATNVTWTVGSNGLSLNAAGYAGTGTTFNGTNASATIGLDSAGLNLSLSVPAAGGGGTLTLFAGGNTTGQSSSSSFNASSLPFSGAGNVSIGYSAGSVIVSGGTAAASPMNVSAGTTSNNLGSVVFSNSNAVSFGLNGSTITASVSTYSTIGTATTVAAIGAAAATVGTADRWAREDHVHPFQDVTESLFWRPNDKLTTVGAPINGSASVIYCPLDHNLSASRFDLIGSVNVGSAANASAAGVLYSITAAFYTLNAGTLSSVFSTTTNNQFTWSSNVTGSVTGGLFFSAPLGVNLVADNYWVGVALSTRATGLTGAATTSLGNTISMMGVGSAVHGAFSVHEPGANTANSAGWFYGMGLYSGTSNFSAIALSNLTQQGTNANRANVALRMINL